MKLGVDVSTYLEEQELNTPVFHDKEGNIVDPFELFKRNGVSYIRLRIWNNPYSDDGSEYLAGTCSRERMLKLAKMLSSYGFTFMIDFHYSDFWADPGKQFKPKAWKDYSVKELKKAVYDFTLETLGMFKKENISVEYIQVGNEITNGMLWPTGQIDYSNINESNVDNLVEFLKSGSDACKEVYPDAKIIVHLEESYNIPKYDYYVSSLLKRGFKFDILGSSYYPIWHKSMKEYFACQKFIQEKYHINCMNVEMSYPFTLDDYNKDSKENFLVVSPSIPNINDLLPYPATLEGQKEFIKEFLKLSRENGLIGTCYWEPLWIKGDKIKFASDSGQVYQNTSFTQTRNEWANQILVDYDDVITPGFMEYKNDKD